MSKLDFSVGIRDASNVAPGSYEIPREVIAEAIVNAVAHRDYASNASVEVVLYKDRLEISNPGSLPLGWTTNMLKQLHNSVPHNPLLAHPMYLAGYIEQLGTGTEDMLKRLHDLNLPEPQFVQNFDFRVTLFRKIATGEVKPIEKELISIENENFTGEVTGEVNNLDKESVSDENDNFTGEVTGEVRKVVLVMYGDMSRQAIQSELQIKHDDYFRTEYISPALSSGLIEMTFPEIPNHPRQRYRLTEKGIELQRIWKLGM